jgi:hypothetical protein
MQDTELLQMALGVQPPWIVANSTFDAPAKRLDIHMDFPEGQSLFLSGLRCWELPCSRHRGEDVATPQLLPA